MLICLQIFYLNRCSISLSNQQMFSIYLYPTSECFLFIYIQPANVSSFPSIMFLVTRLEAHLTSYKLSYIYLTTFWLNLLLLHNISLQTLKYSQQNIKNISMISKSILTIYLSFEVFFSTPPSESTNFQFPIIHVTESK